MSEKRYLILAEGRSGDPHYGKTARGVIRYAPDPAVAVVDSTRPGESLDGVPVFATVQETLHLKPTTALQMIAVKDIGKYGLLAFEQAEELNRREIDLAGDAHTMPPAAQILSKAAGRTITFQPVPIAEVRKASEDYALMLEWFDRVGYNADISGNVKRYGIKPTTLAEWAASVRWS